MRVHVTHVFYIYIHIYTLLTIQLFYEQIYTDSVQRVYTSAASFNVTVGVSSRRLLHMRRTLLRIVSYFMDERSLV